MKNLILLLSLCATFSVYADNHPAETADEKAMRVLGLTQQEFDNRKVTCGLKMIIGEYVFKNRNQQTVDEALNVFEKDKPAIQAQIPNYSNTNYLDIERMIGDIYRTDETADTFLIREARECFWAGY